VSEVVLECEKCGEESMFVRLTSLTSRAEIDGRGRRTRKTKEVTEKQWHECGVCGSRFVGGRRG
jgi:rubrerythrin